MNFLGGDRRGGKSHKIHCKIYLQSCFDSVMPSSFANKQCWHLNLMFLLGILLIYKKPSTKGPLKRSLAHIVGLLSLWIFMTSYLIYIYYIYICHRSWCTSYLSKKKKKKRSRCTCTSSKLDFQLAQVFFFSFLAHMPICHEIFFILFN